MLKTSNEFLFFQLFPQCLNVLHNGLYKYFMNNNLLPEKQFGFQINNSNELAILQFTRDIAQNFVIG